MEAMWHGERFVGAYRLLWELVGSGAEGSRAIEYRRIWLDNCKFPEYLWATTLGSMPEPTASKWQVMHAIVEKLEPLFELFSFERTGARTLTSFSISVRALPLATAMIAER